MRRKSSLTSHLESDIIKRVRSHDGISRVALARSLDLAASTAGTYVERLIKLGYIVEEKKPTRDAGRPPVLLRLNPHGGAFIGVDFEARNIRAVAVDFKDQPQCNAFRPVEPGEDAVAVMRKIEDAVEEVMPADRSRLLALGVGVPGIIDPVRGVGLSYKYIDEWHNVGVRDQLRKKFGVPVFIEHNIRAMALAEAWFGQGRGVRNFICVGVRSGIGVGLVLNGRLYRGEHYNAGIAGRWRCSVAPETAAWYGTTRANAGSVELQEVASARSIPRVIQAALAAGELSVLKRRSGEIPLADVIEAACQRDALTLRVVGQAALAIGQAVGRLALLTDPARVIMAGPLTQLGDLFLRAVREEAVKTIGDTGFAAVEIVNSTMGDFGSALGAAALALEEWKPTPVVRANGPALGRRRLAAVKRG
jgi:N-acetylglucosamine repressor